MREQSIINHTDFPLSKTDLKDFFNVIGLKSSDHVVVHTSLSRLGYVVGGAQAVLESLLETLHAGTLIMPSHSGDVSDPVYWENPPVPSDWIPFIKKHMPAFDPETTPVRGVGKVAQQFLALKGVKRSSHPEASFAALGVCADALVATQPLTPMFGNDSPLGRLMEKNGKVLMLGAPLETMSALHVSEALSESVELESNGNPLMINGERTWVEYEDYAYDSDDFESVAKALHAEGILDLHYLKKTPIYVGNIKTIVTRGAEIIKSIRHSRKR